METTISSSLNCFCKTSRYLAWYSEDQTQPDDFWPGMIVKIPPLWKCQVCSWFNCYFWSNYHLHLLRAAISLKVFTTYFSLEKEMIPFKRNLTDFLCMILSCVCFFVARKYRWRFLRGCWTGRAKCNFYLLGPIWPYFGFVYSGNFSEQLQKYLVVI